MFTFNGLRVHLPIKVLGIKMPKKREKILIRQINCWCKKDAKNKIEFLNSIDPPGAPQHILNLKVGCVVMLLRNLNPPKLCNGTRIQVTSLHDNLIRGKIISGEHFGDNVTIPRIPIIPEGYPFKFKRVQFQEWGHKRT